MFPELFEARMQSLLGAEYAEFLASYDRPRNVGLRVNPLKTEAVPDLSRFGLTPVPWAKYGYYYDPNTRPGLSAYHEAGLYYLQEPSAMAPAGLLDVRPGMKVLDLCAAPGGKTTQLAAALKGEGLLICNEINPKRAKILARNIERLGIANALVLNEHPQKLEERFAGFFDRILVDAPCSGEGMFRKDDTAVSEWSVENVLHCAQRQKGILEQAAAALRPGGYIVYATCTFSPEENEMVVDDFLQKNPDFELIPVRDAVKNHTDDGISYDGCTCQTLHYARRFYPHKSRGEGQFMAVLRDRRPCVPRSVPAKKQTGKVDPVVVEFLNETLVDYDPEQLSVYNGNPVYAAPAAVMDKKAAFSCGVTIGEIRKNYVQPHHQFFMAMGRQFKRKIELTPDSPELERYLHGEEIAVDCENGWAVVTTNGCTVGGVKVSNGRAKNHYPKGLRKLT